MANATLTLSITMPPVTGYSSPDGIARNIAAQMLAQAAQAVGAGVKSSGNLKYGQPQNVQALRTFAYTPPS